MDWLATIGGLMGPILPFFDRVPAIRAVLGFILVFFLPGFAWTLVFFRQINLIERLALSFGLSIATVTLSVIALHQLIGIRITGFNSALIILAITIVPLVWYGFKRLAERRQRDAE